MSVHVWTRRSVRGGLVLAVVFGLVATFGAWRASPPPGGASACCLEVPSIQAPFGTAVDGRDLLDATVHALSTSAAIAAAAALCAFIWGVGFGGLAALLPSRGEALMMRTVDVLAASPYSLVVVMAVLFARASRAHVGEQPFAAGALGDPAPLLLDPRTFVVLAVAGIEWPTLARAARACVQQLREQTFVRHARGRGVSRLRLLAAHGPQHLLRPLVAYGILAVPPSLATESFFSFLGCGVEAPNESLGTLLHSGVGTMAVAPLTFLLPAAALLVGTVALQVVGGALRDQLNAAPDPRPATLR